MVPTTSLKDRLAKLEQASASSTAPSARSATRAVESGPSLKDRLAKYDQEGARPLAPLSFGRPGPSPAFNRGLIGTRIPSASVPFLPVTR